MLRSKKSIFVWNGQKWSRGVQRGAKWSKTLMLMSWPFWTLLDYFGALPSLPYLAIFGPKWTIFLPSPPAINVGPQCKKRLITRSPMYGLLRNTKTCYKRNLTVLSGKWMLSKKHLKRTFWAAKIFITSWKSTRCRDARVISNEASTKRNVASFPVISKITW